MTLEVATFLDDLNLLYPEDNSDRNEIDDHIRLVKAVLKNTFLGDGAADLFDTEVTDSLAEMNTWDARIADLEAQGAPDTFYTPVFGMATLGATTVDVNLAFTPTTIITWGAVSTDLGDGVAFHTSLSFWHDSDVVSHDASVGPSIAQLHGFADASIGVNFADIIDVASNSFTYSRHTGTADINLFYLAIA